MAKTISVKQFALQLASAAHIIKQDIGDCPAQLAVYGSFLKRLGIDNSAAIDMEAMPDASDLGKIFAPYFSEKKDPAVYFYEDFLRAYDPNNSKSRGVHYSPPAVVSYMVRGIAALLESRFGRPLSDAVVVDPCCGVGTFLRHIEQNTGHMPKMIGMELMPVPCEIAGNLTNNCEILQMDSLENIDLKLDGKPLVILGNPPYSGHSSNNGKIIDLMSDYRTGLTERNPKWLQDDYVKFIRMAQKRVDDAGRGIVAFITNHSFVFNPTFRVMRSSLMKSFDEIFVLDLHGNAKSVDGDENIFNIQMGVSISFMIKTSDMPDCKIKYTDLRGSREDKLNTLSNTEFDDTPWEPLDSNGPFFLFRRHHCALQREFDTFPSIMDLFELSSVGFVTSRDSFAVDFNKDELLRRIAMLRDGRIGMGELGVGDLNIENARTALRDDPNWEDRAIEVLYRPFDKRWAYYSKAIMERTRLPFMNHMMQENIAIAIGRAGQVTGSDCWDVVFCTDCPTDLNLFRRGGAMLLPLYVYSGDKQSYNIKADAMNPQRLFYYIYAMLHSSIYRNRYTDFLKIDYPRIPIAKDSILFEALADIGRDLMEAHLMRGGVQCVHQESPKTLTIGGYKMPEKYLVDRKHRIMSKSELQHVNHIGAALVKTIDLMEHIDSILASNPPWADTYREVSVA